MPTQKDKPTVFPLEYAKKPRRDVNRMARIVFTAVLVAAAFTALWRAWLAWGSFEKFGQHSRLHEIVCRDPQSAASLADEVNSRAFLQRVLDGARARDPKMGFVPADVKLHADSAGNAVSIVMRSPVWQFTRFDVVRMREIGGTQVPQAKSRNDALWKSYEAELAGVASRHDGEVSY